MSAKFFKNMVVTALIPYNLRLVFRGVKACLCGSAEVRFGAFIGAGSPSQIT
jgi:hypothetical protein